MNKWTFLKIIISVTLIYFVYSNIVIQVEKGSFDIINIFLSLKWNWIGITAISMIISQILGTLQWKILLSKQRIEIPYWELLKIFYIGVFFNNFMLGNIGGDIKKIYDIKKYSNDLAASFTATVFDRIFGLFVLNGFCLAVGLAYFYDDPGINYLLIPASTIFMGILFFILALVSNRVGNFVEIIFNKTRLIGVKDKYNSIRKRFYLYRKSNMWSKLLALSLVIQILRVLASYFVALALGVSVDVSYFLFFIPLVAIVTALPISIGGFGPREFIAQKLFCQPNVGVSALNAVLIQLIAYIILVVISLFGGYFFISGRSEKK